MIIKRRTYEDLIDELNQLRQDNRVLQAKILEYEDDSGEAAIRKIAKLAKMAGLREHEPQYQDIMTRVFMDIGGRESNILKGYSHTAFMKDNPEEILKRVGEFAEEMSIITKQITDKSGKK